MRYRILLIFLLAGLCWNCAQQGSPSGGPRDEDPPVVLECTPSNYSTRFDAKKIQIAFDEYIVLDNVNQELIVSPPMEEKPAVKLRKKTVIIQFEEELKANTTYTFNFGSSIKDLHEGNKLLNYEYVFSTGDVLDSMSVKGTLHYAKDLKVPDEPITIMLYDDLRDSVPLQDIPLYVGRSDDSGVFSVNNLRSDIYKVFALKDGNYNLLFDLPTEEIAFLDTSMIVNAEFARRLLDESDTAMEKTDSIPEAGPDYNSIYIELMLFTEESEIQYLMNNSRDDRRMMQMIFARPLTDSFHYRVLGPTDGEQVEILEHFSVNRDTLSLWLKDSVDYQKDTLALSIHYTVKDTSQNYVTQTDTLLFAYREKSTKKKKNIVIETPKLTISTIRNNGEQDLHRDLLLDLNVPLDSVSDSMIRLFQIPDSIEVPVAFTTRADTLLPTRAWISSKWESNTNYRMILLPGAVTPIYDLAHDTVNVSFRTRDEEFYGRILLTVENVRNSVIIELINKDKVVMRRTVKKDGEYIFSYLYPQTFRIKFTHDLNENGRWDTGNYLKKQQPEPVEFLSKQITVRSNWDHDVSMSLKK